MIHKLVVVMMCVLGLATIVTLFAVTFFAVTAALNTKIPAKTSHVDCQEVYYPGECKAWASV